MRVWEARAILTSSWMQPDQWDITLGAGRRTRSRYDLEDDFLGSANYRNLRALADLIAREQSLQVVAARDGLTAEADDYVAALDPGAIGWTVDFDRPRHHAARGL